MSTITTILGGDLKKDSRAVINTNFSNLNTDKIETSYLDTDTAMAANSDVKIPSQKAVKTYIDTSGGANASTTVRGIVEEATAAEVTSQTATGGTGARLFINPSTLYAALKFGGSGSDGALAISSGTTTIDCTNLGVITKNYTSISITGTGKLAFSNPHANGTTVILKSQGAVTVTSSTVPAIDVSSMGAPGGALQIGNGTVGTKGNTWLHAGTNAGGGGTGNYGGGGGAASFFTAGTAGVNGGGTGGLAGAVYSSISFDAGVSGKVIRYFCGAGGGEGANGGGSGGQGGRGGGCLIIECGGALNITGTLSVAGGAGSVGVTNCGGGGGGAGGYMCVLYNILTANSGTFIVAGGAGGAGAGTGGAGGAGAAGLSLVALNTEF